MILTILASFLKIQYLIFEGLSNPILMRLDVESKLSDQLKVTFGSHLIKRFFKLLQQLSFFIVREDDKPGTVWYGCVVTVMNCVIIHLALLLHILHHMIQEGHQTVLFTETKHHVEYFKLVCTGILCNKGQQLICNYKTGLCSCCNLLKQ